MKIFLYIWKSFFEVKCLYDEFYLFVFRENFFLLGVMFKWVVLNSIGVVGFKFKFKIFEKIDYSV